MIHRDLLVSQNRQLASCGSSRTRELESELLALQEQLHRLIATELHDSTCQHLVAASLGIMQIKNALDDPPTIEKHCDQLDVSISRALKELRSVAYLLLPQDLVEGGLKAAIEQYVAGFAIRTSLVLDVSISPEVDSLPYETQRSFMRIAQEGLMNVHRHARATRVELTIQAGDGELKLEIRDDGQGMVVADDAHHPCAPVFGAGLRIVQARLHGMGGRLKLLSSRTSGYRETVLLATVPYEGPERGSSKAAATRRIRRSTSSQKRRAGPR
ncbi:sensor histidine kinase [Bradyrhizobium sp.]|uniref:sensor histidine kinase n=1 Tax=Bradyrhizobium sp. TaxID=376 RepID=UPI002CBAFD56|nr:histidine kinase [Bradyrhizobium sp.]HMM88050.1 histidine kinase [Bradyrhizobium sp.]